MALIIAVIAGTVNILMAVYSVGKDACAYAKDKIRSAKKMENYKESLEWKKNTLLRTKARVGPNIDNFGTKTVALYNQWATRVENTDAQLHQYLARCQNAKAFHKRANLGEKGSILAKKVERLEYDCKIFNDPRYRTRQSSLVSIQTHGTTRNMDSFALNRDASSSSSSFCCDNISSYSGRMNLFPSSTSTNTGGAILSKSISSGSSYRNSSSSSSFPLTASTYKGSIGLRGSRGGSSMSFFSSTASTNTGSVGLSGSRGRRCNSFSSTASTYTGSIGSSGSRDGSSRSFLSSTASTNTGNISLTGSIGSNKSTWSRISNRSSSPTWTTAAVHGDPACKPLRVYG